jgi:enoyl-CoA hydratase/carnithine racemase
VYLLTLGNGEQRFSAPFVRALSDHLDSVAADQEARALITLASGKIWAYGLDLDWMAKNPASIAAHVQSIHELYARMLELPVISIAAIQGHVFAAGAIFALTHDFRLMRRDRGYFCLPEVDLGIAFTPGMSKLLRARLSAQACHAAVVGGRRFGGEEASAAGIVDEAPDAEAVLRRARELASEFGGKPRETLVQIRKTLYADVIAALRAVQANHADASHFAAVLG